MRQAFAVAASRIAGPAHAAIAQCDQRWTGALACVAAPRVGTPAIAVTNTRDEAFVYITAIGAVAATIDVADWAAAARGFHGSHAHRGRGAEAVSAADVHPVRAAGVRVIYRDLGVAAAACARTFDLAGRY
jgi:hypothetical protein